MKIRTKTLQSTIPLFHHTNSPVHCLYTPPSNWTFYRFEALLEDIYLMCIIFSAVTGGWDKQASRMGGGRNNHTDTV